MKIEEPPKTLNEAIEKLFSSLSERDIESIEINGFSTYHFSVGTKIRNIWQLWEKNSPIKKDLAIRFGLSHGDDCSGLIFAGAWARLKKLDLEKELEKTANSYKEHWLNRGIDPLTMEIIDNEKYNQPHDFILKIKRDKPIKNSKIVCK